MNVKHNSSVGGSQINWWYFTKFKKMFCHKKNERRCRRTYTQRNFLKFAVLWLLWGNFYRKVKFSTTIDLKNILIKKMQKSGSSEGNHLTSLEIPAYNGHRSLYVCLLVTSPFSQPRNKNIETLHKKHFYGIQIRSTASNFELTCNITHEVF
jgi:hypothetical protein